MIKYAIFAAALALPAALLAADEPPQATPEADATAPVQVQPDEVERDAPIRSRAVGEDDVDASDVRCRYVELIGSRIPQRICRTEAQWALMSEENQEAAQNTARNGGRRSHAGTIY